MGNLHAGHASLLARANQENDITVLSIFINPTQFNKDEDYLHYPKSLDNDLRLANQLNIDYVLAPTTNDIYPDNFTFKINETLISQLLEGKHRPGHFEGMLTVVMKLFSLVKPNRAYFGEKDFQQLCLVKNMVTAFFLDIEIVSCPTVRNQKGLALSSRNNRLTADQLLLAEQLPVHLTSFENEETIQFNLQNSGFKVDYLTRWNNRLLAAVYIDNVRLIDNIPLK